MQKDGEREDVTDRRQPDSATSCHGLELDWDNCFRRSATDKHVVIVHSATWIDDSLKRHLIQTTAMYMRLNLQSKIHCTTRTRWLMSTA